MQSIVNPSDPAQAEAAHVGWAGAQVLPGNRLEAAQLAGLPKKLPGRELGKHSPAALNLAVQLLTAGGAVADLVGEEKNQIGQSFSPNSFCKIAGRNAVVIARACNQRAISRTTRDRVPLSLDFRQPKAG